MRKYEKYFTLALFFIINLNLAALTIKEKSSKIYQKQV